MSTYEGPDSSPGSDYLDIAIAYSWVALIAIVVSYNAALRVHVHRRTAACRNDAQSRFRTVNYFHGALKKHLLHAPLFRKRHYPGWRLSAASNVGTLPDRIQAVFLVAYLGVNIALTSYKVDYGAPILEILNVFAHRAGTIAMWNMLPLFLLAGRNNPLLTLTAISFDGFNLIHRWLGRIVAAEATFHGACWIATEVMREDWGGLAASIKSNPVVLSGTIAGGVFIVVLLHSPSVVRHCFYETFLHSHILLAMAVIVTLWFHFGRFPIMQYLLYAVIAVWVFDRTLRLVRIVYRNVGNGGTRAECELLHGDVVRITAKLARPWRFQPGQHAYIFMPSISWCTNHPFSVALSEEEQDISFLVRRRNGFTDSLWKEANQAYAGEFSGRAFLEGPYGSQTLRSYSTVLLFAAGVGISHQIGHVGDLVAGYSDGTVGVRKVVLVWINRSLEHWEWISPWMDCILALPKAKDILKVMLFVTREQDVREIQSPIVQTFHGRPNVAALLVQEIESAVGPIAVSVCGTGALADDVREASRKWMDRVNIDFHEEGFSL